MISFVMLMKGCKDAVLQLCHNMLLSLDLGGGRLYRMTMHSHFVGYATMDEKVSFLDTELILLRESNKGG